MRAWFHSGCSACRRSGPRQCERRDDDAGAFGGELTKESETARAKGEADPDLRRAPRSPREEQRRDLDPRDEQQQTGGCEQHAEREGAVRTDLLAQWRDGDARDRAPELLDRHPVGETRVVEASEHLAGEPQVRAVRQREVPWKDAKQQRSSAERQTGQVQGLADEARVGPVLCSPQIFTDQDPRSENSAVFAAIARPTVRMRAADSPG